MTDINCQVGAATPSGAAANITAAVAGAVGALAALGAAAVITISLGGAVGAATPAGIGSGIVVTVSAETGALTPAGVPFVLAVKVGAATAALAPVGKAAHIHSLPSMQIGAIVPSAAPASIRVVVPAKVGVVTPRGASIAPSLPRPTEKLLSYLPRFFDTNPHGQLAMRINHASGSLSIAVVDWQMVLKAGSTVLAFYLPDITLLQLKQAVESHAGFSVPYFDATLGSRGASRLYPQSGRQEESNGDHVYAYTTWTWSVIDAFALELARAKLAIVEMLKQMDLRTAAGEWIDEWNRYYGQPREGRNDPSQIAYTQAEVLRVRSNNKAMEAALEAYLGLAPGDVEVLDATQERDPSIRYDGTYAYNNWVQYAGVDLRFRGIRYYNGYHFYDGSIPYAPWPITEYCVFRVIIQGEDMTRDDPRTELVQKLCASGTWLPLNPPIG
jgi:hypothetical protein